VIGTVPLSAQSSGEKDRENGSGFMEKIRGYQQGVPGGPWRIDSKNSTGPAMLKQTL
jgi:hypothetical protein